MQSHQSDPKTAGTENNNRFRHFCVSSAVIKLQSCFVFQNIYTGSPG